MENEGHYSDEVIDLQFGGRVVRLRGRVSGWGIQRQQAAWQQMIEEDKAALLEETV